MGFFTEAGPVKDGESTTIYKKGRIAGVVAAVVVVAIIIAIAAGTAGGDAAAVDNTPDVDTFNWARGKFLNQTPQKMYNLSSDRPTCEAACLADTACTAYGWGTVGESNEENKQCWGYTIPQTEQTWYDHVWDKPWGIGQRVRAAV